MSETAPASPPDLDPVASSHEPAAPVLPESLLINPNQPLSTQVHADALRRARSGLEGLGWQQHGKRYEVTDYDLLDTARQEMSYGPGHDRMGIWGLKNKETGTKRVRELVPQYTVTAYDAEGNITGTTTWKRDELDKFFDKDSRRPPSDQLSGFGWNKAPEKPDFTSFARVAVRVKEGEEPFKTIMNQKTKLGLDSLKGLRLTLGGQDEEVVDQFLISHTEHGRQRSVVAYATKIRDLHGNTIETNTYIDDGLQKRISKLVKTHRHDGLKISLATPKDLPETPEVPEAIDEFEGLTDEERAWAGWLAVEPSVTPAALPTHEATSPLFTGEGAETIESVLGPALTIDQVHAYFAGEDIYTGGEFADRIHDSKGDISMHRYAKIIARLSTEMGSERVLALARGMRNEFLEEMYRLNLVRRDRDTELAQEDLGIGWALIELAKARYADQRRYEHDGSLATYEGVNPLRDTPTAKQRQNKIIAKRLGQAFENSIVTYALQPILDEDGEPKRVGGRKDGKLLAREGLKKSKKEIMRPDRTPDIIEVVEYDRRAVSKLSGLIQQDVVDIIQRGKRNAAEHLVGSELTKLGLLLRQGLGR